MGNDQTIEWLRGLAEKGGKGVVNNIDARSLGRIADDLMLLQRRVTVLEQVIAEDLSPFDCSDELNKMVVVDILRLRAEKKKAEGGAGAVGGQSNG
jgi:hypothetical protein